MNLNLEESRLDEATTIDESQGEGSQLETRKLAIVIEDDEALETVVKRVFKSIDPDVQLIWTGNLADARDEIARLQRESLDPSIILSDIFLPNFESGTALWNQCQSWLPKTPFVFMSSLPSDRYLKMFPNSQSPPFIPKPFSISECREILESFLKFNGPSNVM